MKIFIKVFAREDMYGDISHTKISNPVEYVLAGITSSFEIVQDPLQADLFLCSIFTVGYNEFEVWFKDLSTEQQKKVIIGGYHPSLCPEDFPAEQYPVALVIGGGEAVINEAIASRPGKQKIFQGECLDVAPIRQSYSKVVNNNTKVINIRTYVGCSNRCEYCCHPIVYSKRQDFGLENIVLDIEKYKPETLFITDADFLESLLFDNIIKLAKKKKLALRFYIELKQLTREKIAILNDFGRIEVIYGVDINTTEKHLILLKELHVKQIACVVKNHKNVDDMRVLRGRFSFVDKFSELWLMPFPKTEIAKKFHIEKHEYKYLNPREAKRFIAKA